MKKIFPILAALLAVCSCDTFKAGVYQDELVMPLQGSANDSLFFKLSIQYASKGMLIPAMEKMNAAIVSQAFDMESQDIGSLEQTAAVYRENLIDEYITENSSMVGELPVLSWEDVLTGEFTGAYKGWRNYQISYYCYRGGAHGYSTYTQIVFDKKTGDTVTEDVLFAPEYFAPVAALMRERVKADLEADNPDILEFLEMESVVPNGNFSVSESGVEWIFQPDDILPHAFGLLSVTVPWEELKPYMR